MNVNTAKLSALNELNITDHWLREQLHLENLSKRTVRGPPITAPETAFNAGITNCKIKPVGAP